MKQDRTKRAVRLAAPSATIPFLPEPAIHLAEILRALGHPIRLRLIALLCHQDLNVSALAQRLGVNQAIISQQLRILRLSGLVAARRVAGTARYRLIEPHLRDLISCLARCRGGAGEAP
ncbi:MAG: metalloregulator ArsR/SmtB family transcription factor [Acidobacteriota bacterium]